MINEDKDALIAKLDRLVGKVQQIEEELHQHSRREIEAIQSIMADIAELEKGLKGGKGK